MYQILSDKLTNSQIQDMITTSEKWWWVSYVMIPLEYLLKIVLVIFCLSVGLILSNKDSSFKPLFSICVNAEFISLIPSVALLVWFGLINTNYTISELNNFPSFSLLNFFDIDELERWQRYPLSKLSLIEFGYVIALIGGVMKEYSQSFGNSSKIVIASYGSGLAIWVLVIVYLQVTLS
jgi:hypothetical protein